LRCFEDVERLMRAYRGDEILAEGMRCTPVFYGSRLFRVQRSGSGPNTAMIDVYSKYVDPRAQRVSAGLYIVIMNKVGSSRGSS